MRLIQHLQGQKNEWQKKFPEWGAFRELQINEFNKANTINAIVFAHKDDVFEDPKTLSFFENFKGMKFIEVEKNAFIEKSKNSIFLSLNVEQKQIYNEIINVK